MPLAVKDALEALEKVAPAQYAFPWDRIGLQVGHPDAPVTRAVVSLDRSQAAVRFAAAHGAQLLLSHHPLIWEPLKSVDQRTHTGKTITELVRNGISFVAAHTNWDAATGGINDTLAKLLGLESVESFGSSAPVRRLQLVTFCPEEAATALVEALAEAGAGVIGDYRQCAFMNPGTGTFKPLEGATPTIGEVGRVESVPEVRIEMVLPESRASQVTQALLRAHPYEEPAFNLHVLHAPNGQPSGRIGTLPQEQTLTELVEHVDRSLGTRCSAWGQPNRCMSRVAVVGGAADGEWEAAHAAGADVLITGEVKQHVALEAAERGFAIIAAGHYATEHPGCVELCARMAGMLPEIEWLVFTPEPGEAGRPIA